MLSTRRPTSRTTAKASGSSWSSVSPLAKRCLNSTVFARSASSLSGWTEGSSALICATSGRSFFSSRSFWVPTTLASSCWIIYRGQSLVDIPTIVTVIAVRLKPDADGTLASLRGEELQRVHELPVDEDFVVQVRAGRTAGGADQADHVAARDAVADLHAVAAQMTVARRETEGVLQDDQVAVVARERGRLDDAVGGRVHRLAFFSGDVDAGVVLGLAAERIAAAAEESGEPAVRRPDRRRRVGELLAAFDVAPHEVQAALESLEEIAKRAERVFGRSDRSGEHARRAVERRFFDRTAHRALTHRGRQLGDRASGRRIQIGARAEIVDDAFKRLNLRGEFTGRGAIARVFDLQI